MALSVKSTSRLSGFVLKFRHNNAFIFHKCGRREYKKITAANALTGRSGRCRLLTVTFAQVDS